MDWQDKLNAARAEYEQLEQSLTEADEQYEEMTNSYHRLRAMLAMRKQHVEGQMEAYGEMLEVQAYEEQGNAINAQLDGKTPEQALAILNGIEQKMNEQNADA